MRLILVRHADSSRDRLGRYIGHTDIGLSKAGKDQVERLRDRLSGEEFHSIYSSDLARALHTAHAIASEHEADIVSRTDLREIDFGEFEGMTYEEIGQNTESADRYWMGEDRDVPFPGGESLRDLEERVVQFLDSLGKHHEIQNILIVSHGGPLRVIVCKLLGLSSENWWRIGMDHASVSLLETFPEGAILHFLNDTCHLDHSLHLADINKNKEQPGG